MSEDKTYYGWRNYETWNVALWIDNDQGSYNYWRQRGQEIYEASEGDKTFTRREKAILALSEELKDFFEIEASDALGRGGDWLLDAVNAYLSEVDWYEVAAPLIEDQV